MLLLLPEKNLDEFYTHPRLCCFLNRLDKCRVRLRAIALWFGPSPNPCIAELSTLGCPTYIPKLMKCKVLFICVLFIKMLFPLSHYY